jgi:hypothetical protein
MEFQTTEAYSTSDLTSVKYSMNILSGDEKLYLYEAYTVSKIVSLKAIRITKSCVDDF